MMRLCYSYIWLIPISHYRHTAQLMKDRDKQEKTYLLAPVLPTFVNIFLNYEKKLVYKLFYLVFNAYYTYGSINPKDGERGSNACLQDGERRSYI